LEGDGLTLANLGTEQLPALRAIENAGFAFDHRAGCFRTEHSRQDAAQLLAEALAYAGFGVRVI